MSAESVVECLQALVAASVEVCLDGGWGVDALLGEETREHGDLDLIVDVQDVPEVEVALGRCGYRREAGGTDRNFVLATEDQRRVDVHAIDFDERGWGVFHLDDGRRWPFPAAAFAGRGKVLDLDVRCLSPDAQVQCHGQGYEPAENDLRDMAVLQERFGVVLPLHLCRD